MAIPAWLKAIEQLAPIIASIAIPGPAGPIVGGLIAHGIQISETFNDASGQQKLANTIELVNTSVAGINAVHPNTIDPVLVQATAAAVISAVVNTANLVKKTPPHPAA